MFIKLLEKLDNLFYVKQTNYTGKRVFFSLFLVILVAFSFPIYFRYEDRVYRNYLEEYTKATQLINNYTELHGEFPLGERVDINKEKDLKRFFTELNLDQNRELYYIDMEQLPEFKDFKYTYIFDNTYRFVYTSEGIVYKMTRWHYAR